MKKKLQTRSQKKSQKSTVAPFLDGSPYPEHGRLPRTNRANLATMGGLRPAKAG
ncbi:hypothetical protein CCE02nite_19320 [Cellulosimicrobium cellulans]|uniref:Uncharacterized protein n=1 Tax=Cellulosimicrobium cellulans TaxID=1710 RepID=A0A4Y4DYZ1_CELCE|nr:hypothetical protein CCE02nite_19320 [Cellulosimicrobium cellulans]